MVTKKLFDVAIILALVCAPIVLQVNARMNEQETTYECEGDACAQVTLTWDNDRQQFRVQNNSDRPVQVEVTTFAGESRVRVLPGTSEYLQVKNFIGPYRAIFI